MSLALVITPLANALTNSAALPDTMASVGDSLSDRPIDAENWTTGTLASVNSIHTRLEAVTGTDIATIKAAKGGADSSALVSQMTAAVGSNADLITVLMGGNDICADTTAGMTSVATFQARYSQALKIADDAGRKVIAVSVPSLTKLWTLGKDSATARIVWNSANICQSALANPLSNTASDVARRALVEERNKAYNTAIATECAQFAGCAYDNGAVYNTNFELADMSRDYFHPNATGQAKLAAAVWPTVERLYSESSPMPAPSPTPTPTPTPTTPTPTTPAAPAPTVPAPATPQPSTPPTTTITKTVKLIAPLRTYRAYIGVNKVEFLVAGKTYTGTIKYIGNGQYSVTVNTSNYSIPSGTFNVKVRAYDKSGTLIYQGTVWLNSKS